MILIFNMNISIVKTQTIVIAKKSIGCKLVVRITQQIMKYNYLDTITFSNRDLVGEIRTQVNNENGIFERHYI